MSNLNISLNPPAGTNDYFPADLKLRDWLFNAWDVISQGYGYQKYDAPVVESALLYTHKGGDDILKEMFNIESSPNSKLVLRPEMTPSLARMVLSKIASELAPIKWYSAPQCWRNEAITRGRRREFYQWNVDMFHGEYVKSEIEIFDMIVSFFKKIGLTSNDVVISVSNRMVLQKVLINMGVSEENIVRAFNLVDKIEKLPKDDFKKLLFDELGISGDKIDILYDLVLVRNASDLEKFIDPNDQVAQELKAIFKYAEELGIADWLQLDLSVIRGLSYYTGTVFEGFFKNTAVKRAICGGGRYDNLLKSYGYLENVPSVGFGMGNCVIMEGLEELGLLPKLDASFDYVVIPFNDDYYVEAHKISNRLREKGKTVELYTKKGKLKNAFSYADRRNVAHVVLVASEWDSGNVVVKNLRSTDNKQVTVNLDEYLNSI